MKSGIYKLVLFVSGALVGGGVGYFVAKKHYDEELLKNVESVKESYRRYSEEHDEDPISPEKKLVEEVKESKPKSSSDVESTIQNYAGTIAEASHNQKTDYTSYQSDKKEDEEKKSPYEEADYETIKMIENDRNPSEPYILTEEEFYDEDDEEYVKLILNLFDDGIITDDMMEPIEDIDKVVKPEDLKRFVDDEDEAELFVKVDSRKCIYCIEKQGETWNDMLERHPRYKEAFS